MIRNIIFDIGNVLTDFNWKGFLREKGFGDDEIHRIAKATVMSPYWVEVDRGVWSQEKLIREFSKLDPEMEPQIRRAYEDTHGIVTKRDYAIPWIQTLKESGCRVYYLSNFSAKVYAECRDALDFLPYMDGGILSYREQLVKPDAAIYRLLMDRYALRGEESVFIDDTKENVEAAKALGIHGICFVTKEQVEEELTRLKLMFGS